MRSRFASGVVLFGAFTVGCGVILGEEFDNYRLMCDGAGGTACSGSGAGGAGEAGEAGGAGGSSGTTNAGAEGVAGEAGLADHASGGSVGEAGNDAAAGDAGFGGTAGAGGSAGSSESGDPWVHADCQPAAVVMPECSSTGEDGDPVLMPIARGIGILSTEWAGGGFTVFASKADSSAITQRRHKDPEETDWSKWLCFDSLPQPDRVAAHALYDGAEEVFATTRCGDLYRRVERIDGTVSSWLDWQPFGLPGSLGATDVAVSKADDGDTALDGTNIVYLAHRGHVYARPRLGHEQSSPYADWREILGISNAQLVTAGTRSDQRQQVFAIDTNGSVRTAIQSASDVNSPFGAWSDFDTDQLPTPVLDIEAPLGGMLPLEVFAVTSDGSLWQRTQDQPEGTFGAWRAWDGPPLSAKLTSIVGAGLKYKPSSSLRLAVLTKAGRVYTTRRALTQNWEDWQILSQYGWFPTSWHGRAAAASGSTIYILSDTWGNNGWQVEWAQPNNGDGVSGWVTPSEGGTSITTDPGGGVWVVRTNGVIRKIAQGEALNPFTAVEFNGGGCGGRTMQVSQDDRHNNLAFTSTTQPYIIETDGHISKWSAGCWDWLPALPSSAPANDIAAYSGALRAADASSNIYYLSGNKWVVIPGFAKALASNQALPNSTQHWALDFESTNDIWQYNLPSVGQPQWHKGVSDDPSGWNQGGVRQIGSVFSLNTAYEDIRAVLTTANDTVWWFGGSQ